MLNERLISTVSYKGQSVGSNEITIEDTSRFPTYTFTITDDYKGGEIAPNELLQLGKYWFNISGDGAPYAKGKVFCRITTNDGKLNADKTYINSNDPNFVKLVEVGLTTDFKGEHAISTNFFPSTLGYSGLVEFFHDPEHLYLIKAFNVSVKALSSANLDVMSRIFYNLSGNPEFSKDAIMGDSFVVSVSTPDIVGRPNASTIQGVPFKCTVGGVDVEVTNPWLPDTAIAKLTLSRLQGDPTKPLKGISQIATSSLPLDKNKQPIIAEMGELKAIGTLRRDSFVDSYSIYSTSNKFNTNIMDQWLPFDMTKVRLGVALGSSFASDPSNRLGSYRLERFGSLVLCSVYRSRKNNPAITVGPYLGNISILSWREDLIKTREDRKQFGKFQKIVKRDFDGTDARTRFTYADISDTIADVDYGVVGNLIGSDIVVLVTTENESGIVDLYFENSRFAVGVYKTDGSIYTGPVTLLVMRNTNGIVNYESWVPYPRVIMANNRLMGSVVASQSGQWFIDVPANSGIDLRDERYRVQMTNEMTPQNGGNLGHNWRDYKITREQFRITIQGHFGNLNPDPIHYALWDMGPDFFGGAPEAGLAFGAKNNGLASTWETTVLLPVDHRVDPHYFTTMGQTAGNFYRGPSPIKNISNNSRYELKAYRSDGSTAFLGAAGLVIFDPTKLTNMDKRNQLGKMQKSVKVNYDNTSGTPNAVITTFDIQDSIAEAHYGAVSSLMDPNLLCFITCKETYKTLKTKWTANQIDFQMTGLTPTFTNSIFSLFLRKSGWVSYSDEVRYPRVIYADRFDIGKATAYSIPLNLSMFTDPLSDRYQLMITTRPTSANVLGDVHPIQVKKLASNYEILLEGDGAIDNTLQVAIIDFGPDSELFGKTGPVDNYVTANIDNFIPGGLTADDPGLALVPVMTRSYDIGGSTASQAWGWSQHTIGRKDFEPSATVNFWGSVGGGGWGYSRACGRGIVGWNSERPIGPVMKRQIPSLVGRHSSFIGETKIELDKFRFDVPGSVMNFNSFMDNDLVVIPVDEYGANNLSFKRSTDGKEVQFFDTAAAAPLSLPGRVNTLVLRKLTTMPVLDTRAPYPYIIYANTAEAYYENHQVYISIFMGDSYPDVNLGSGRYQLMWAFEKLDNRQTNTSFADEDFGWMPRNSWRLLTRNYNVPLDTYRLHVCVIDMGP